MLKSSSTILSSLIAAASFTIQPLSAGVVDRAAAPNAAVQPVNLVAEGPVIELLTPENGGIYTSPIGIDIAFAPKDGSTIDLTTLKVTVVSTTVAGVFELDITEDIIDYASEGGIKAPKADIPAGEHVVTIQVADSKKRVAERQLSITVREESIMERRERER